MGLFEYVNQRVGPYSVQEALGDVGSRVYLQVDDDVLPVGDLTGVQMVTAGRMRITNENTGDTQELGVGEGSYEIERRRGRLRYEAIEADSRFICVSPAKPGHELRHKKIRLGFARTARVERRNCVLMLCAGEVMAGEKFAAAPAVLWLRQGDVDVFAMKDAVFIEFWLEEYRA